MTTRFRQCSSDTSAGENDGGTNEVYEELGRLLRDIQQQIFNLNHQFRECKSLLEMCADKLFEIDQRVNGNEAEINALLSTKKDMGNFVRTLKTVFKERVQSPNGPNVASHLADTFPPDHESGGNVDSSDKKARKIKKR